MAGYLVGFKFTEKGLEKIKESPLRLESMKKLCRQSGVEVKEFYLLLGGRYDTVALMQAPNEEVIAKTILAVDALGNVTSETARAFTEDEYRKIIGSLP